MIAETGNPPTTQSANFLVGLERAVPKGINSYTCLKTRDAPPVKQIIEPYKFRGRVA